MRIKIIETADGSTSLYNEELDETYHSRHGAIQEALHIFIGAGLIPIIDQKNVINILEMGFGTGLNAWLTAIEAQKHKVRINYVGIEAYPVKDELIESINYTNWAKNDFEKDLFQKLHKAKWEADNKVDEYFYLQKIKLMLEDFQSEPKFDLIYFDAFGPNTQPHLWTEDVFRKMLNALKPNGILMTYSVKGSVRRAMGRAGFKVEKIPGPPGKREISRAMKVV